MCGIIVNVVVRWGWVSSLSLALLLASAQRCDAQSADQSRVKGTVGGAMVGSEVVLLAESALRLQPTWAYLLGGGLGALGGGYLGNRIGDGSSNKPPSFLLAGGIALIIPTIMGVLTATQYQPPATHWQDTPEEAEPGSAADANGAAGVRLELPSLAVAQAFSREELALLRARQVTELHLTVLHGAF